VLARNASKLAFGHSLSWNTPFFVFRHNTVRHSTTIAENEIFYSPLGLIYDRLIYYMSIPKYFHITDIQQLDISTPTDGRFDRIYDMSSLLTTMCKCCMCVVKNVVNVVKNVVFNVVYVVYVVSVVTYNSLQQFTTRYNITTIQHYIQHFLQHLHILYQASAALRQCFFI
jgi:hypothetical protein